MPLGLSHRSGGVRHLVNLSWLRLAYKHIVSSHSSLDKMVYHDLYAALLVLLEKLFGSRWLPSVLQELQH